MKNKKGKGIAMTFFTGGFVVLFVGGVYVYTQSQIKPMTAYEFSRDIPVNTQIQSSDLKAVSIPKSAVASTMVLNKKDIVGEYNNTKVFSGEYVIKKNLVKKKDIDPFASIDTTKLRMVSIPAKYEDSIGGDIKRGDRVDLIYVGQQDQGSKTFTYSKTFLSDVLVYATTTSDGYQYVDHSQSSKADASGQDISANSSNGDLATVTLAVTLDQAEQIEARLKTGEIKLAGRFSDSQDYDTAGYVQGDYTKIFSGTGNAEVNK